MRILGIACAAALAVALGCERRPDPNAGAPAPPPEAAAPRIVVLSPALAVTIRELGFEPLVVGRHAFDLALDESVPVCGDQNGIDYEALMRAQPTHVLIEWGSRELPVTLTDLGAERGWRILRFELLTLGQVVRAANEIEALLAPYARTPQDPGSSAGARIRSALARRAGLEGAGRVLLLLSVNPLGAIGPGSCHHEVLASIGGVPAIEEGSPYMRLEAEDLVRMAPDSIVLISPRARGAPSRAGPMNEQEIRALFPPAADLRVPALSSGRVALLDDPRALLPSTSLIAFADELAWVLEIWAVEEPAAGDP